MAAKMRAKFMVSSIKRYGGAEELVMTAVAKSGVYPEDGSDEDNTYAKWSPSASLTIQIANPALHRQFNPGEKYYVDFTPAEK
jgi:hypothetical protein